MLIKHKGLFFGLFSGITWALDTVLIGVVLSSSLFLSTNEIIFLAPLISTFLHDTMSSVWMIIYTALRKDLKNTFSKFKTKSGLFVMLGALLGGPIGMTFYVLAVKYIGASYTASISAIYPAIGALFAYIFLKDRLTLKNCLGLFISILFIFLLGYSSGEFNSPNYLLGFMFALVTVLGWGLECVICAHGMKGNQVSPEQALQIRQLVSTFTFALLIIPFFKGYPLVAEVMISTEFILIGLIALSGTTSYVFYYKAIYTLGPTRAMALNITYSSWAIILGYFIVGTPITLKLIVCSLMIIFGSILTVANSEELKFKNYIGIGE